MYANYSKPIATKGDWWYPLQHPKPSRSDWDTAEKYTYLYIENVVGNLPDLYAQLRKQLPKDKPTSFCAEQIVNLFQQDEYFPIYDLLNHLTTKVEQYNESDWGYWMIYRIIEKLKKAYER